MENKFQKVSIIGYGNVSSHLVKAFCNAGIEVTHILVRIIAKYQTERFNFISNYAELPKNQLVIVCVPDDLVACVIQQIDESCSVAYTSGAVHLSNFDERKNVGVFYPLQTFTKGVEVDISSVPFFIESDSPSFGEELVQLAKTLSKNVKYANSDQRAKLHLAAVWVNNFTNHINFIAKDYLEAQQLDFDDLLPLLHETILKIEANSPYQSQTGPARRNDSTTIEKHLNMLPEDRKKIYQAISESIIKTYSKNDKL